MFEQRRKNILKQFEIADTNSALCTGKDWLEASGSKVTIPSPADEQPLADVNLASRDDYNRIVDKARQSFKEWRKKPAPERGDIIRQIGIKLRANKEYLGSLVSLENGKIVEEGLGEVQEMIDICDFATGLSRQLYGFTMASERPGHRMFDHWHPVGVVGIISAFNFPVAVYSWNAFIAATCGNTVVWKPSDRTPLTAMAVQSLIAEVLRENDAPEGVFNLCAGGTDIGKDLATDKRINLLSATGSTGMGKQVAPKVAERLGKSLLELGGNNAIIISDQADLELALRAVVFGAVGTAGQRCTTTRRLIIQRNVYDKFKDRLLSAYKQLKFGHPLDKEIHVGPLISKDAVNNYLNAIERVKKEGGTIAYGGEHLDRGDLPSSLFVNPALAEVSSDHPMLQEETFGPLLYLTPYDTIEEALKLNNDVPQGLSSAIFTLNLREAEYFLSNEGSDCGFANVNIGTSGAEIGGAFGGEKDTGGGREAGSEAWKNYMWRQTTTINYSNEMPLAQGINFDL